MCGICGIALPYGGKRPTQELLRSMCSTIVHRGPDDEGIFLDKNAALGARRLSIIDLETGHQPQPNEDESVWVALNGEIYNFPELRKELQARGHRFITRSDTETLVHGFEEWGEGLFQKIRGMYAFAIWEKKTSRLTLVRDRIGIKPLYYTLLEDGSLVFGSELKAVLVHPGVKRSLNPEALDIFLTLEYIPAPHSIFRNIDKLPPGHRLTYQNSKISIKSYWELRPGPNPPKSLSSKELEGVKDELYALIRESVKLRLISDVPLGSFLSGGIDSSAIVGLMREVGAEPLKTFSIGFDDDSYNELPHARRIAEKFQTDHEEYVLRPQALDLAEKLVSHLDEPLGDFSIFPTFLVSKMARKHVKVILSGDGGDELFAGYEHYKAQKIAGGPVRSAFFKPLSHLHKVLPPAKKKKGAWNNLLRFGEGFNHPASMRHFRWAMFLSRAKKRALYTGDLTKQLGGIHPLSTLQPFQMNLPEAEHYDPINGELFLDLKTYLADDILVKVDRMSMATSLETRVPLLDHKIVEFIFRIKGTYKLNGMTSKWIFKKTMEKLLPHQNIYRKKEGFSIPIKRWLKKELRDLMEDHLNEKRIREGGLFEWDTLNKMKASHLSGRKNYSHQLWALLIFEIWRENYL